MLSPTLLPALCYHYPSIKPLEPHITNTLFIENASKPIKPSRCRGCLPRNKNKKHIELTGYESAQRKRFLRSEAEDVS